MMNHIFNKWLRFVQIINKVIFQKRLCWNRHYFQQILYKFIIVKYRQSMNFRKNRFSNISNRSKHSLQTSISQETSLLQPIRSRNKTTHSTSDLLNSLRMKENYYENLQTQSSLDLKKCRNRSKSLATRHQLSSISHDQKIVTGNNLKNRKYSKIDTLHQSSTSTKKNHLNLISNSSLRQAMKPIQYQQQLPPLRKKQSLTNSVSEVKNYELYEGQEVTPRRSVFSIFVEGDPLTNIYGNNQICDLLRRHQNFNNRLFRDIPLYRTKQRGPRSIIQWKL